MAEGEEMSTQFSLAEVRAAIRTIEQSIANGAVLKRMEFADQEYEFRSMDEMLKVLAWLKGLEVQLSGKTTSRLAATSKGA
jgi:hypothetical protein